MSSRPSPRLVQGEQARKIRERTEARPLHGPGRRVEAYHRREEKDPPQQHLWRRHRPAGGRGDEELRRINVFDWNDEDKGFGRIMRAGGFDAVIGNPPYGYMIPRLEKEYFLNHYHHQDYQKDNYLLFLERYEFFLKFGGLLGIIVSNTWLQSVSFRKIRKYLTTNYKWQRILFLPEKVFKAVIDTHVLIFERADEVKSGALSVDIRRKGEISLWSKLPLKEIPKNGEPINIIVPIEAQRLFRKIQNQSSLLKNIYKVYNGVKP